MNDETKTKLTWVGGIAVAIFVVFLWPHTSTWDGDGQIDAFPSSGAAKNYRLDASMTVTSSWYGWIHTNRNIEYSGITGQWPDGGTLELRDCTIADHVQSECTDQDGKDYGIEVISAPNEPDADYSSAN